MRKTYSRTYRFKDLSVTISIDDVFVLYRGKEKIYFYKFKKNPLSGLAISRRMLAYSILGILCASSVFIFTGINTARSDEEKKDRLIVSKQTDFSAPKEHVELSIRVHKVKKGETLSHIAKDYGISMDTICGNNKLPSYDIISEGTVLKIPNKDGILYSVKQGQNISAISRIYRISVEKILAENNLKNGDFVSPGEDIFIPDAKPLDMVPGFLWPVAARAITCGYGWRRNPFNVNEMDFHPGLDMRANYEWVKATKYGKVTYAGWLGGYGKAVLIAHPNGWKSLYGHLSRIIVNNGQYVKQGQYIGRSGNTGYSTGSHLHFELIKNGKHLNPYGYIK